MLIKNSIKRLYYAFNKVAFPAGINFKLGYVFHTEEIFNPAIHQTLIRFCKDYIAITGTKCICVTMTPPNKRVERGMRLFNCSNQEYINRMQELSEVAHVGFHGHFWHDPEKFEDADFDIRKHNTNYNYEVFYKQFEDQINWFYENNVSHNNTYSGGWWFINKDLIELLVKHNIQYDYTISKSPNLWNPYTQQLVKENDIHFGETFYTSYKEKKLLHVQNLHSGHNTPFVLDATRYMNTLIEKEYPGIVGVLNSHDYCLDYEYTINWMKYLVKLPQVSFLNHEDLVQTNINDAKIIELS
jgi:hypothetical protein